MEGNSTKNKVFSGIFWKFGERLLAQGISFVVSIVLARLLMPKDYGIVAMVIVFITLADVFVSSGFGTALIQKKDADDTDFSTIFYCSMVVSVVIYLILFFAAPLVASFYKTPSLVLVLRVFSLKIPISAYNSIQHAYVSRHMIFKRFFFSTLFGTLLSGVVGIVMALAGFGVWALIGQYLTNSVVDCLVLAFTIPWHPQYKFSWTSAKELMSYGWKVLAADLTGTFFDQLRSLIIGKIYTKADLAYYNKGKQIPTLLSDNISTTVMTVLFPAISNEGNDLVRVKQMIRRAVRVMAYIIFPLMAGCIVVARPLILLLLTSKWQDSIIFMQLLCIQSGIGIIGKTSLQSIKAIGRSDTLLKLEMYKKPVYIILLVVGAYFSVLGIAITSVIYAFYSVGINGNALKKLINYSLWEQIKDVLQALFLSLIMCGVAWLITFLHLSNIFTLCLQVLIGAGIYIGLSKLLKVESYLYIEDYLLSKLKRKKA